MTAAARTISTTALLLLGGTFALQSEVANDPGILWHSSGLQARITLPDGAVRAARLEGVGCTLSICSRVEVKGIDRGGSEVRLWLDEIASIKHLADKDVLLTMKDGSEHRLTLVKDFRVLYLGNESTRIEKLDLSRINSLEFLPSAK